jgi:hypothetical protein
LPGRIAQAPEGPLVVLPVLSPMTVHVAKGIPWCALVAQRRHNSTCMSFAHLPMSGTNGVHTMKGVDMHASGIKVIGLCPHFSPTNTTIVTLYVMTRYVVCPCRFIARGRHVPSLPTTLSFLWITSSQVWQGLGVGSSPWEQMSSLHSTHNIVAVVPIALVECYMFK